MSRSFIDAGRVIATNNISVATTSTASATTAFSAQTRAIRVAAPAAFFVKFGNPSATPTAAATDCYVPANWPQTFVVTPGQKASAYSATIQTISVVELE